MFAAAQKITVRRLFYANAYIAISCIGLTLAALLFWWLKVRAAENVHAVLIPLSLTNWRLPFFILALSVNERRPLTRIAAIVVPSVLLSAGSVLLYLYFSLRIKWDFL